jgi:peroxiredoxin
MKLQEKTKAPEFSLIDEKGQKVNISDFLGKPVVLYFYPKDDTRAAQPRPATLEMTTASIRRQGR